MSKESLVFDSKLFKRLQATVSRRLEGTGKKITLSDIRDYVADNSPNLDGISYNELVTELVSIAYHPSENTEETGLAIPENLSQENSLINMSDKYQETKPKQESGIVPSQPTQPTGLSIPQSSPESSLSIPVQDAIGLDVSTRAVIEQIINHEINTVVGSAQDLQAKLGVVRELESTLVSEVLTQHVKEKRQTINQITHTLGLGGNELSQREVSYTQNFHQTLEDVKARFKQSL